jgi:hypothetical protein
VIVARRDARCTGVGRPPHGNGPFVCCAAHHRVGLAWADSGRGRACVRPACARNHHHAVVFSNHRSRRWPPPAFGGRDQCDCLCSARTSNGAVAVLAPGRGYWRSRCGHGNRESPAVATQPAAPLNLSFVDGPVGAVIFALSLAVVIGDFIRDPSRRLGRRRRRFSIAVAVAFAVVALRFKFLA